MRRFSAGDFCTHSALLAILVLVPAMLVCGGCDSWVNNAAQTKQFGRIQTGMTLAEVEKILGKGQQEKAEYVPRFSNGHGGEELVVKGKEFYVWKFKNHEEIWIGITDGRVSGKYHYFESL